MIIQNKMRCQYDIKNNSCSDCLIACFCEFCALIQKNEETKMQKNNDVSSPTASMNYARS